MWDKIGRMILLAVMIGNSFMTFPYESEASPSNPDLKDRFAGWLDHDKIVQDSEDHFLTGFGFNNERMNLTIADVNYSGATSGSGKVANYSRALEKADNGYPIVDQAEAIAWAQLFNGNPAFLKSENGLHGGVISGGGGDTYTGYLLSKVAEMSGGRGNAFTFRPSRTGEKGSFVGVTSFTTTQRPDGAIRTDKTTYNVGDLVTITAWGKDYSIYNRGLKVYNYYIYNLDTGQTEKAFYESITDYPIAGEGNGSGQTVNFPQKTWIPTKAGNYEARILFTDSHARNTKNAPAVNGPGVPYFYKFTVGTPPPPKEDPPPAPEDPPPPKGCQKTTMDIRVESDNSDRELKGVTSGGDTVYIKEEDRLVITASKPGTFTQNGIPLRTGSGGNRNVGVLDYADAGSFTITYTSDDGTLCWEKVFYASSGKKGEDGCPIVQVNNDYTTSGSVIEVIPGQQVSMITHYIDKYGNKQPHYTYWLVTLPDGKTEKLPVGYDNRDRPDPYQSDRLTLPYGSKTSAAFVPLEPGKTYKVKLDMSNTNYAKRPECDWEITIKVKDQACTIDMQKQLSAKIHGQPPHEFPPSGDYIEPVFGVKASIDHFTKTAEGYDTHLMLSANMAGKWYLNKGSTKSPLSGPLQANGKFQLLLPSHIRAGDALQVMFVSDDGCIFEFVLYLKTNQSCFILDVALVRQGGQVEWERSVKRGEKIEMSPEGFTSEHSLRFYPEVASEYQIFYLDPKTQQWSPRRDGKWLGSSNSPRLEHTLNFPKGADGLALEGLYKIYFYPDNSRYAHCDGVFFVQIGEGAPKPEGENLLIIKSSFAISPKDPQAAGTDATITFDVKNEGKEAHDTILAVRWESSEQATRLDVKNFRPGEVRKITVPTKYPQQSENFIANINPEKNRPEHETVWPDNRAQWPVSVKEELKIPAPPGGGGNLDGGEIELIIIDSGGRELQKLTTHLDGVWEREPATIRVVIGQTKINQAYERIKQEINQNIQAYQAQLYQSVSGEGIKNVSVTATPGSIADAKSMAFYAPTMLDLRVGGPGNPQEWRVSSASAGGDYLYTGTVVPTQTTWRQTLQSIKYQASINGFVITVDYRVQFDVNYDRCSEDEEGEETCSAETIVQEMTGRYTVTVKGSERTFEVFEPNAKGVLRHTAEWLEYTARDRYPANKPDDFYAGERILTHVLLEPRHQHPVSGQYPEIAGAQSWISETGLRQTPLQSTLALKKTTPLWWQGPSYTVPKLGQREMGVDTPLMGDKQKGFQKGASYAVYFTVRFRFGAEKGFAFPQKQNGTGHDIADYRVPFTVTANAWERQGIRNHTTR
ncbi:ABC transporter permease [Brevibacillus composti]|uniref:ABC transporter permease n=1 Tax=Brevibacillus composti TaxID=2796470 RepID=A0A7T5EKG5_9BACL|nr:ABC transporter permease [Brevibacillus composti]QQE74272.1 ABC transporter permease [Brevibacillus composti]QUO41354.1 ABC transporter permease [Brevibacillus composti]